MSVPTEFIHPDFLLETDVARQLYHDFAAARPIVDYHCHLSPADLATNRRFENLFDIWLAGDHYKWRLMRAHGEPEACCTGSAEPYEKFLAFARTVPATLRNPMYHWTHLELVRYFGITELLSPKTAPRIWAQANEILRQPGFSAWSILEKFRVRLIGTTDDPTDDLAHHRALSASACPARVVPSFRPDRAFQTHEAARWNAWTDALAMRANREIGSLGDLLAALEHRLDAFAAAGCVASDHGLERCPEAIATEGEAEAAFRRVRGGQNLDLATTDAFTGYLLAWLGGQYAARGWAMQLHLGATRNNHRGLYARLGPDIGCDSIGDLPQVAGLRCLLGELSARGTLPKTILYNLNPAANYAFATMAGNFSAEGSPGHLQFGSGWWFLDQLEGMTWQLNALSSLGMLRHFVGMLTDSRSFMSYPRHEYFRRLLCNLLGQDLAVGKLPVALLPEIGQLVSDVCFGNAARYFGLPEE